MCFSFFHSAALHTFLNFEFACISVPSSYLVHLLGTDGSRVPRFNTVIIQGCRSLQQSSPEITWLQQNSGITLCLCLYLSGIQKQLGAARISMGVISVLHTFCSSGCHLRFRLTSIFLSTSRSNRHCYYFY